jgi:hypothetical protein
MFNPGSLFHLPAQDVRAVASRKNEFMFCQGDRSDSLFCIELGTVKAHGQITQRQEAPIEFYDQGHLFGESPLNFRPARADS